MTRVTLKGSARAAMAGSRILAPADPTERLEVSVLVRRRALPALQARVAALAAGDRSGGFLSREDFARLHGADAADLAAVRKFAAEHGLAVVQEHAARRTVVLSGTVAQFNGALSVQLQHCATAEGTYRGRTGEILLPAELDGIVVAILGLDDRPQAKPHIRFRSTAGSAPLAGAAAPVSFNPTQVASLYGFPSATGDG